MFAVYPTVIEPRSIAALEDIGKQNLELTKPFGLDYDEIVRSKGEGIAIKNKMNTFCSFED